MIEPKGVWKMAMRTTNSAFWNIIYAIIVILVFIALLQLLGVFTLTPLLSNILYILIVVAVILAVVHLLGLF